MKSTFIYLALFILLVVGCTKEEIDTPTSSNDDFEELEIEVAKLSEKLVESEKKIEELTTLIDQENRNDIEVYNEINSRIYILESLMSHIPNLETRFGYINEVNVDGSSITLEIQFADMKQDDSAPNGFVIEEKEVSIVTLDPNASYFILVDGVKISNVGTVDELEEAVNEYSRLFKIYMANDEIVMLTEQYIP
ncbi:hypothetical protein ACOQFO_11510 [Ureibacillus sp. MALMAid1270]|uniref:hypothetical protein n=1 Tax=Ureibacillus sp. MALMAid1270 TaxID=3411629 RepID=UPI003BA4C3F3